MRCPYCSSTDVADIADPVVDDLRTCLDCEQSWRRRVDRLRSSDEWHSLEPAAPVDMGDKPLLRSVEGDMLPRMADEPIPSLTPRQRARALRHLNGVADMLQPSDEWSDPEAYALVLRAIDALKERT